MNSQGLVFLNNFNLFHHFVLYNFCILHITFFVQFVSYIDENTMFSDFQNFFKIIYLLVIQCVVLHA